MKPVTNEWLTLANMDLASCRKMRDDNFLTSIVSFHAQQAVEKSFKAIIEEFEIGFIRTHDLLKLHQAVKNYLESAIDVEMLTELNELYISTRYPGEFGLLPNGKPAIEDAERFYEFALDIFTTVQVMLSHRDD